jgi:hypothetical protein
MLPTTRWFETVLVSRIPDPSKGKAQAEKDVKNLMVFVLYATEDGFMTLTMCLCFIVSEMEVNLDERNCAQFYAG